MEGTVYGWEVHYCTTCRRRASIPKPSGASAQRPIIAIERRARPIWRCKYQLNGRPVCVSTGTTRKEDAQRFLRDLRLIDTGAVVTVNAATVTFEDAAADLLNDYVSYCARAEATCARTLAARACANAFRSATACSNWSFVYRLVSSSPAA